MDFPASWNDSVLVVLQSFVPRTGPRHPKHAGGFGRTDDPEALAAEDVAALVLRWHELVALEAVEPPPGVRIEFRHPTGTDDRVLAPRPERAVEDGIDELFRVAAKHAPRARIDRGWLDEPSVDWERVEHLPGDEPRELADGYRERADRDGDGETIVARRAGPGSFVLLLQALFGTGRPLRELVLGSQHLYGRDRDGTLVRLPRAALRGYAVGDRSIHDRDEVFVFGRRTRVLLTEARWCPVATALRQQLDEG